MTAPQKFSDAFLRTLVGKSVEGDKRLSDPACTGLRIRLRPQRAPQWEHVFTVDGKTRFQSLGSYPEISLADARALVEARRRDLVVGRVPDSPSVAQKQARVQQLADADRRVSVEKLYRRWFRLDIEKSHRDQGALVAGHMERHVIPSLGEKALEDVSRKDVLAILDVIKAVAAR